MQRIIHVNTTYFYPLTKRASISNVIGNMLKNNKNHEKTDGFNTLPEFKEAGNLYTLTKAVVFEPQSWVQYYTKVKHVGGKIV